MWMYRVLLALALVATGGATRAQVVAEQLTNHLVTGGYATTYTPAAGADRVVVAIIYSEHLTTQTSTVRSVRLGGSAFTALGSIQNSEVLTNRLSVFVLPESAIPAGTSTLSVSYGPLPSSGLVYLATLRNVDQGSLASTVAAFSRGCSSGVVLGLGGGRVEFAPAAAAARSLVFSFVATADNDTVARFRNGGAEFLDRRIGGPDFSLAGALQSPSVATTIAGSVDVSDGCDRRPAAVQFALRGVAARGADGVVTAPAAIFGEGALPIQVADPDLNASTMVAERVTVVVENDRTGEVERVVLIETGPNTGVYAGQLPTRTAPDGQDDDTGQMVAVAGDRLLTSYVDGLTTGGGMAVRTATTLVKRQATLAVAKSSAPAATAGPDRFAVPGADVIYTLTVSNVGEGPVDAGALFLVDPLPRHATFYNGPALGGSSSPVVFADAGSGVQFDYESHVRFAGGTTPPADFAACTATPAAGYDVSARYLCVRPAGQMAAGTTPPSFTLHFRVRVD